MFSNAKSSSYSPTLGKSYEHILFDHRENAVPNHTNLSLIWFNKLGRLNIKFADDLWIKNLFYC